MYISEYLTYTLLIREFATTSREPIKDVAMRTWVICGVCCVGLRIYLDIAPDCKLPLSRFPLVASLKCGGPTRPM